MPTKMAGQKRQQPPSSQPGKARTQQPTPPMQAAASPQPTPAPAPMQPQPGNQQAPSMPQPPPQQQFSPQPVFTPGAPAPGRGPLVQPPQQPAAPPLHERVGRQFVHKFYSMFNTTPDVMYRFYEAESAVTVAVPTPSGGATPPAAERLSGDEQIMAFFERRSFSEVFVYSIDVQPSAAECAFG